MNKFISKLIDNLFAPIMVLLIAALFGCIALLIGRVELFFYAVCLGIAFFMIISGFIKLYQKIMNGVYTIEHSDILWRWGVGFCALIVFSIVYRIYG